MTSGAGIALWMWLPGQDLCIPSDWVSAAQKQPGAYRRGAWKQREARESKRK